MPETRAGPNRFDHPVQAPCGRTGTMPNGETAEDRSTLLALRSPRTDDRERLKARAHPDGGAAPVFTHHRARSGIALAQGACSDLLR